MGSASLYCSVVCFLLVCATASAARNQEIVCPFRSIYQFGASLSDTGNLIRVGPIGPSLPAARLPYGKTFPGRPTGRWSDGLLIVDFTARSVGLPLLNPYLDKNASFSNGVNFAVAGSTALDFDFLAQRGIFVPNITVPLGAQIDWFKTYLSSICSTPSECKDRVGRSLFFVAEIGRNDMNFGLQQGKTIEEVEAYVPNITASIVNAVKEIILLGGKRIVVPGTFPLGCFPNLLSQFGSQDPGDYDELGCLRSINNLTIFRNNHLQQALVSLRNEVPDAVVILYADYYAAFQSFLARAPFLGFDRRRLQETCCGSGGGEYNYDGKRVCGFPGVVSCPNPAQYVHWDGIHLTQAAYFSISLVTIPDILSRIQCF